MNKPKKLIEVAMPIKEISAESVRDKSIRHGHLSTLHLWWARRPLPVCRAVVFASLVPDPLDPHCPKQFAEAVELLLGPAVNPGDPYKPYDDIPFTVAKDRMEDNLRNRLLMFIGKYSDVFMENEKRGIKTETKNIISDFSMIKWDNKNNEEILNKARKLIWISHNAQDGKTLSELSTDFDNHNQSIKSAERDLYTTVDRHIANNITLQKTENLNKAIDSFLNKMPSVFDPFAGGGAIPLEAARLGCRSFGNDINPVAHIIQRGGLEYPQKYGKPSRFSYEEFVRVYGSEELNNTKNVGELFHKTENNLVFIENQLAFDVEYYSKKLLQETKAQIGPLYPKDKTGNDVVAYYWARVGNCSNPTCNAEIPLLKRFYLCNTPTKKIYLDPEIRGSKIEFRIKTGSTDKEGWMGKNLVCPFCKATTASKELKQQSIDGKLKLRMLAVITESSSGKSYRLPTEEEVELAAVDLISIDSTLIPNGNMQAIPDLVSGRGWGISKWAELFSPRQLLVMTTLVKNLNDLKPELMERGEDYSKAVLTYLAILIDRISSRMTSFGLWDTTRENLTQPFGRQAIPMVFDFPESNPFCSSTGSALNQLDWLLRFIESESSVPFGSVAMNTSSGEKNQFPPKSINATVTDPPYYDVIAYADLSDFFYVWLKKTLGDVFPLNFATPQTPKSDECTALKHYHNNDADMAKQHFENKLLEIFDAIELQTSDIVSIMFAHQSTDAWTTLCNSILAARMNITGSWATDTEMPGALKTGKLFLSSSVTVACKPSLKQGTGDNREVKKAIEETILNEVEFLYRLGYRGADLLTACFGKAVAEFGKYQKVEKTDGSIVTVAELLTMARESAFNALLRGFKGDDFTRFYIAWLQLYGFTESDFDDAAKFTRVGLSINVSELFDNGILINNGNRQSLGTFEQRIELNKNLGDRTGSLLIDKVHKAMYLFKSADRHTLIHYVAGTAPMPEDTFWRVITSLCEILPFGCDDHKAATGLLTNKESLLRDIKTLSKQEIEESNLFQD